jgi:hypothetical protein
LNVAYNLEFVGLAEKQFRVFLFPRRPGGDVPVPGVGALSPNFGGWELSGDIVIPTHEIFIWCQGHPAEAARLTEGRLRDTTRTPP